MGKQPKRHKWRRDLLAADISDRAKVVGCALAEFFNDETGDAWPSVETLATTHRRERTVQRGLRELSDRQPEGQRHMNDTVTIIDLASKELTSNLSKLAVVVGEGAGVRLYACCHVFTDDGLTADLLAEAETDLPDELADHILQLPMGADILARKAMFRSFLSRAESAMLGRYDMLAAGGRGE